jgi:hypothetical protein
VAILGPDGTLVASLDAADIRRLGQPDKSHDRAEVDAVLASNILEFLSTGLEKRAPVTSTPAGSLAGLIEVEGSDFNRLLDGGT